MQARGSFVLALILTLAGLALMGLTFLQKGDLDGRRAWDGKLKLIKSAMASEEYPSPGYVASQQEYEKALQDENARIDARLELLGSAVTRYFDGTAGPNGPAVWNEEFGKAVEGLLTNHEGILREMDPQNPNFCPVVWDSKVPEKVEIPVLQVKFWIFKAILEALAAHQPPAANISGVQRSLVSEVTVIVGELPKGQAHKKALRGQGLLASTSYRSYHVFLKGHIPYDVLVATLDDLGTANPDVKSPEARHQLLFVLRGLEVNREHADPEKPTVLEWGPGTLPDEDQVLWDALKDKKDRTPEEDATWARLQKAAKEPDVVTAPGLQCKTSVNWEVRMPLSPPEEEE